MLLALVDEIWRESAIEPIYLYPHERHFAISEGAVSERKTDRVEEGGENRRKGAVALINPLLRIPRERMHDLRAREWRFSSPNPFIISTERFRVAVDRRLNQTNLNFAPRGTLSLSLSRENRLITRDASRRNIAFYNGIDSRMTVERRGRRTWGRYRELSRPYDYPQHLGPPTFLPRNVPRDTVSRRGFR